MLPYSTRFLGTQNQPGWNQYSCPPGFRAVLKDVSVFNGTGASISTNVQVANVTVAMGPVTPGTALRWSGMMVFYAGETVRVDGVAGGLNVLASGYLLREAA